MGVVSDWGGLQETRQLADIFVEAFRVGGFGNTAGPIAATTSVDKSINTEITQRNQSTKSIQRSIDALTQYLSAQKRLHEITIQRAAGEKTSGIEFLKHKEQLFSSFGVLKRQSNEAGTHFVDAAMKANQVGDAMWASHTIDRQTRKDINNQQIRDITELAKRQNAQQEENLINARARSESMNEFWTNLKQPMKNFRDTLMSATAGQLNITRSVVQGMGDFAASMKFGTDVSRGLFENQIQAARLGGLDPSILSEIAAQGRQAGLAMGGMNKWFDQINKAEEEYFGFIGDHTEATRFAADTMLSLAAAGIRPIPGMDALRDGTLGLNKSIFDTAKNLQKMGLQFPEIAQLLQTYAADESIRQKLTAVSTKKERLAIMNGIMARHEELMVMGMTKEQAQAVNVALGSIAGLNVKDRFKSAAKTQALAGALGMEGGNRIGELMRKGQRMTPSDRSELTKLLGSIQAKAAESTMGSIGKELMMDTLVGNSGMEQFVGKSGILNTKLAETQKINTNILNSMQTMGTSNAAAVEATVATLSVTQAISNNIAHNPLLNMGLGVLQMSAGTLVSILSATIFGNKMAALRGKTGAITGMGGMGMPKGASVIGKIGSAIAKVGMPIALLTTGIQTFGETAKESAINAGFLSTGISGVDKLTSTLRNLGDNLTFGGAGWLGSKIGELLGPDNIVQPTTLHTTNAPRALSPEQRRVGEFISKTHSVSQEIKKSQETQQEFINNMTRLLIETNSKETTQAMLSKFDNMTAVLTAIKDANLDTNNLNKAQLTQLIDAAADGKITKDEIVTINSKTKKSIPGTTATPISLT